jgi:hypothetical protein
MLLLILNNTFIFVRALTAVLLCILFECSVLKEQVVTNSKNLSQYLAGNTEVNHEKL